jgi:transcriptional regulator with XRE-family HTH domain
MAFQLLNILRKRRRELRLSLPALAARSGVSLATLKRMFRDGSENASLPHVCAVADAMGISIRFDSDNTPTDFCEKVAEVKARKLVKVVQGTSALEAQAVEPTFVSEMVRRTVHDLVAGSPRRLWA